MVPFLLSADRWLSFLFPSFPPFCRFCGFFCAFYCIFCSSFLCCLFVILLFLTMYLLYSHLFLLSICTINRVFIFILFIFYKLRQFLCATFVFSFAQSILLFFTRSIFYKSLLYFLALIIKNAENSPFLLKRLDCFRHYFSFYITNLIIN